MNCQEKKKVKGPNCQILKVEEVSMQKKPFINSRNEFHKGAKLMQQKSYVEGRQEASGKGLHQNSNDYIILIFNTFHCNEL